MHRFPNQPVRTADGLHWNTLELYRNVLVGLRKAIEAEPGLLSIGIDSWAIDYALVRATGHGDRMTSTPYHYRDPRTSRGVDAVHELVEPKALYRVSGLQFLPFSLYQLAVDHAEGVLDDAMTMLLIPDLIAYWLTGTKRAERTDASTTGLLNIVGGDWNTALIDKLGFPRGLFPQLVNPGETIGQLTSAVASEIGAARPVGLVAVGSHDTASAVAAVPMLTSHAAYICSGTWSLIGVELDQPVLTEQSRIANFTNERGVDGRIRYLRNVMGMWLVNEMRQRLGTLRAPDRPRPAHRGGRKGRPLGCLRRRRPRPAPGGRHATTDHRPDRGGRTSRAERGRDGTKHSREPRRRLRADPR